MQNVKGRSLFVQTGLEGVCLSKTKSMQNVKGLELVYLQVSKLGRKTRERGGDLHPATPTFHES